MGREARGARGLQRAGAREGTARCRHLLCLRGSCRRRCPSSCSPETAPLARGPSPAPESCWGPRSPAQPSMETCRSGFQAGLSPALGSQLCPRAPPVHVSSTGPLGPAFRVLELWRARARPLPWATARTRKYSGGKTRFDNRSLLVGTWRGTHRSAGAGCAFLKRVCSNNLRMNFQGPGSPCCLDMVKAAEPVMPGHTTMVGSGAPHPATENQVEAQPSSRPLIFRILCGGMEGPLPDRQKPGC